MNVNHSTWSNLPSNYQLTHRCPPRLVIVSRASMLHESRGFKNSINLSSFQEYCTPTISGGVHHSVRYRSTI